jgi:hypothetical protein
MSPNSLPPYSLEKTKDYLAAYGANSALWPDPKRAALALELYKETLAGDISKERALETWLAPGLGAPLPAPSERLSKRILNAAALSPPTGRQLPRPSAAPVRAANDRTSFFGRISARRLSQAAALLVIAAAGIGTAVQLQSPDSEAATEWQEAALDLGLDDVYSWVMDATDDESS